jgi:hypothetical protein
MAELLGHFIEGVRASSPEDGVLAFAKIFEYVSATMFVNGLFKGRGKNCFQSVLALPQQV